MNEFQEKYKVIVDTFSTGSTTEKFSQYHDMQGFRRIDFLVSGLVKSPATGALGATDYQKFTIRAMVATDSTGGGAAALSSATSLTGKDGATAIGSAMKCRQGFIFFSTLTSAVPLEVGVGSAVYTMSTAAGGVHAYQVASQSDATVACQAFVAGFNSTVNNTATAITAKWEAATEAAAVPWVRIIPKNPDGTDILTLSNTAANASQVGVGGVFQAHIGIDAQYLGDRYRYVALGIKSTEHTNPYTITVIKEPDNAPVKAVTVSVSLNQSTSK